VDADSGTATGGPTRPVAEPRQRWRLAFGRRADAPAHTHRELVDDWLERLARSGLPLPLAEGARQRSPLTFAAPLPLGMAAERELADLALAQRLPIGQVRDALTGTLPDGIDLVDLYDVWLGAAPLAASIAAADYRVELGSGDDRRELERAVTTMLAAREIPRRRSRGSTQVDYDLRPLVDRIEVAESALRIRTLFDPTRGAGRPEEVVGALGDLLGQVLEVRGIVRERLILADELPTRRA
jgi:radical SAM-linked protein